MLPRIDLLYHREIREGVPNTGNNWLSVPIFEHVYGRHNHRQKHVSPIRESPTSLPVEGNIRRFNCAIPKSEILRLYVDTLPGQSGKQYQLTHRPTVFPIRVRRLHQERGQSLFTEGCHRLFTDAGELHGEARRPHQALLAESARSTVDHQ